SERVKKTTPVFLTLSALQTFTPSVLNSLPRRRPLAPRGFQRRQILPPGGLECLLRRGWVAVRVRPVAVGQLDKVRGARAVGAVLREALRDDVCVRGLLLAPQFGDLRAASCCLRGAPVLLVARRIHAFGPQRCHAAEAAHEPVGERRGAALRLQERARD